MAIPIPIQVVSHSFPFPFPNFITNSHSHGNPMGFPFPLGIPFPWSSKNTFSGTQCIIRRSSPKFQNFLEGLSYVNNRPSMKKQAEYTIPHTTTELTLASCCTAVDQSWLSPAKVREFFPRSPTLSCLYVSPSFPASCPSDLCVLVATKSPTISVTTLD